MSDIQTRIADGFLAHTPSGSEGASLVNCWCGERFDTFAHHAEHAAAAVIAKLELTQEWSDDVAGPGWQRYSYWRTPTVSHPGPSRLAAGLS